jgi:hypothetical protein
VNVFGCKANDIIVHKFVCKHTSVGIETTNVGEVRLLSIRAIFEVL